MVLSMSMSIPKSIFLFHSFPRDLTRWEATRANNDCDVRDLRARLELCLDRLVELCSNVDCRLVEEKVGGEEEIPTDTEFLVRSPLVTAMVRKELAVCIRDLIHHGLGQSRPGAGILPFSGCMSGMSSYVSF